MGLLDRMGLLGAGCELIELAGVLRDAIGPEPPQDFDVLVAASAAPLEGPGRR